MMKGRDIFLVVESGRNGFMNNSGVAWDTAACDEDVEIMACQLIKKFGERPDGLAEWYAGYSGPTF
jgi:hypothetical protein